jgi:hypothetical protein
MGTFLITNFWDSRIFAKYPSQAVAKQRSFDLEQDHLFMIKISDRRPLQATPKYKQCKHEQQCNVFVYIQIAARQSG